MSHCPLQTLFVWLRYRNPWGFRWHQDWFIYWPLYHHKFLNVQLVHVIPFAISTTVATILYTPNSVGNSWNLRSVTGFGVCSYGCLLVPFFDFSYCYSVTISLISHLIPDYFDSLLFSRTIFFVIIIVTFFVWSSLFLRRVSTTALLSLQGYCYGWLRFVQLAWQLLPRFPLVPLRLLAWAKAIGSFAIVWSALAWACVLCILLLLGLRTGFKVNTWTSLRPGRKSCCWRRSCHDFARWPPCGFGR